MADPADNTESVGWWKNIFALREVAANNYQADPIRSGLPRLYGGQVGAQSLLAAAATVDSDRVPHSLQTSFLHAGDDTRAITYEVDRVRDSRSMSTRVVTAQQDGRMLATSVVSFHLAPSGDPQPPIEHEWPPAHGEPVQPLPDPDTLPSRRTSLSHRYGDDIPGGAAPRWPVDLRYVDQVPWSDSVAPPRNRVWLKTIGYPRQISGADAAVLAFATDLPMFEPVYFPTGIPWRDMVSHTALLGATLNHWSGCTVRHALTTGCCSSSSHPSHTDTGHSAAANCAPVQDNSWRAWPRRWFSSRRGPAHPRDPRNGQSAAMMVRPELLAEQLAGDITGKLVDQGQPFG